MLHQPGHLGDALRGRPRQGRRHPLRPRPLRGRRDGGRGRLLAHGRAARRHAPASGAGPRQWPRQSPQRAQGQLGHRQRRGRARDLPHQARRAAHVGHRGHRAPGLGLGAHVGERQARGRRRRGGHRRGMGAARAGRDAHPSRRHGMERGDRSGARARREPSGLGSTPKRWPAAPRPCARASRPCSCSRVRPCASGGSRWPGASRTATGARILAQGSNARIARGAGRVADRAAALPRRPGAGRAEGHPPPDPRRRQGARRLLRVPGQAERPHPRRLRDPPAVRPRPGLDRGARVAGRRGGREEERRGRAAAAPSRPAERPAHARDAGAVPRRAPARRRHRLRRIGDDGPQLLQARPPARRRTTG